MTDSEESARHFSMIRSFHLADLFTIANGFCGVAAIFQAMQYVATKNIAHLYLSSILIPVALVFDILDGHIARWRQKQSPMGREMDSLADVISFGVAPACIAFSVGLNYLSDQIILIYFAACGLSRLARFNITAEQLTGPKGKVKYYEGTPIPTSILPLGLTLLAFEQNSLFPIAVAGFRIHLVSLLYLISGSLMISKTIRIPKL